MCSFLLAELFYFIFLYWTLYESYNLVSFKIWIGIPNRLDIDSILEIDLSAICYHGIKVGSEMGKIIVGD